MLELSFAIACTCIHTVQIPLLADLAGMAPMATSGYIRVRRIDVERQSYIRATSASGESASDVRATSGLHPGDIRVRRINVEPWIYRAGVYTLVTTTDEKLLHSF